MKIGVFDSGLGGLFTLKALTQTLPAYDYVYLGDTKRLPYGSRSHDTIYQFLIEGVEFLFSKNCSLVIIACNTASAEALLTLQQEYLPKYHPTKKVLGMIVPLVEEIAQYKTVGLIGTSATISSGAYQREAKKRTSKTRIISQATPLLVPLIESGEHKWIKPITKEYISCFKNKKLDALILGCTHYAIIKSEIQSLLPKHTVIISQDTIIPQKTKDYLKRHPEITTHLSQKKGREFYVTDTTDYFTKQASVWFGKKIRIQKVHIEKS